MSIREIASEGIPVDPIKPKKSTPAEPAKTAPKDSLEVSGKAKSLYNAGQVKKYEEIRQKLDQGFYDRPEVTEKVVDALLEEIKNSFTK